MLVDPEYLYDYIKLPTMNRITYMMSCSLREVIANATKGHIVLCSLLSIEKNGNIIVYCPMNGLDIEVLTLEHITDSEKNEEQIISEVITKLTKIAKRNELEEYGEPFFPIKEFKPLFETDERKIYWCPISPVEILSLYSNKLFILLCDEFGRRWAEYLSKNSLKENNEFWDETSRRVIGISALFVEYVTSLLLKDCFDLGNNNDEGINLLAYLNILSSQPYEGRSCKGMLCLLKTGIRSYTMPIVFEEKKHILERSIRENRKLLEMTDEQHALIVQKGCLLGIGDKKLCDDTIKFFGNSCWLFEDSTGNVVFRCDTGTISISEKTDDTFVYSKFKNLFGTKCNFQSIIEIISAASSQKHGTGIVFTDDAEQEAKRLNEVGRCILIKPVFLGNHIESIFSITRIDGALIIDPYGTCYAVGAIVDGKAVIKGSSARGARYNSLANYVAWQKQNEKRCLAVIISEDGTIDIV